MIIDYVAFLRGINVGGKNVIRMAELQKAFEMSGYHEVKTYIQSGNVIFQSEEEEELVRSNITDMIEMKFGIQIPVVVRTANDLNKIISSCPFTENQIKEAEEASDTESLYIALLNQEPSQDRMLKWLNYKGTEDECKVIGRTVYLLFRNSIRNSKLANHLTLLDNAATTRNWKTLCKITELIYNRN